MGWVTVLKLLFENGDWQLGTGDWEKDIFIPSLQAIAPN
ncbi:hypothetical protein NUACC26_092110 [Scytonema sp. NUACC26]